MKTNKNQESTRKTASRVLAAILAVLMCASVLTVIFAVAGDSCASDDHSGHSHAAVTAISETLLARDEMQATVYTETL